MHPLAGVEGSLHLVVGNEARTLVERLGVRVCGDFDPVKALLSGKSDDIYYQFPSNSTPHPIGIYEEVFHLDRTIAHEPRGEPDDSGVGFHSDPRPPLGDALVGKQQMFRVRQEVIPVALIRQGGSPKHSAQSFQIGVDCTANSYGHYAIMAGSGDEHYVKGVLCGPSDSAGRRAAAQQVRAGGAAHYRPRCRDLRAVQPEATLRSMRSDGKTLTSCQSAVVGSAPRSSP